MVIWCSDGNEVESVRQGTMEERGELRVTYSNSLFSLFLSRGDCSPVSNAAAAKLRIYNVTRTN
jgi:hypothetical protein